MERALAPSSSSEVYVGDYAHTKERTPLCSLRPGVERTLPPSSSSEVDVGDNALTKEKITKELKEINRAL